MTMTGVGYRSVLSGWLNTQPELVQCLEITAEHFYDPQHETHLQTLADQYKTCVHALGLSLGTPGPLDPNQLNQYARVVELTDPAWISEHISYTRSNDVDLGHLNPVPLTQTYLDALVDHTREIADRCQKPVILENVTAHQKPIGDIYEPNFISELCERAGCGLLLDITNLYINSHNHHYDPKHWLAGIDPELITQIHIVGYIQRDGKLYDSHHEPIQNEILDLLDHVLKTSPVKAITLERDDDEVTPDQVTSELTRIRSRLDGH